MRLEFRRKKKSLSLDKVGKKEKKKNVKTLNLLVIFYSQKKKLVSLFFIYNFYFENLIYKWIK